MGNIIIQYRKFPDNTYSIIARVYNPSKKFYEHPTLINLTEDECFICMDEIMEDLPSIQEIERKWTYIGN